ncbi:MAG TPA: M15 family metallopeptidase [Gammaproteobacteria bacterium]|nr:M15 family metallopeptidase [Gammaproteobacteria bacterium]
MYMESKEVELLIADPRVLKIPVEENHEAMIDIISLGDIAIGPSPEIENNTDYTQMRKAVYDKLVFAQTLLPKNIKFCLYEAYRSLNTQEILFDARKKSVQEKHPELSGKALFDEITKLVSPIINFDGSVNIPPHATGAAVDVYLIDENGHSLDMGIHPKDWLLDIDGILSKTGATQISAEAKKNRQMMSDVLSKAGFVNYFTEFWHWSYGDRYCAYQCGKSHAIYGVVNDRESIGGSRNSG